MAPRPAALLFVTGITELSPEDDRTAGHRLARLPRGGHPRLRQRGPPPRGRQDGRRQRQRRGRRCSPAGAPSRQPGQWERVAGGRPWLVAGVLVAVPALAAGVTIAALPAPATSAASAVTVSRTDCAPRVVRRQARPPDDHGDQQLRACAGEINLDNAAGAVVGEIETIGPGTSAPLTATLGSGTYTFRCLMGSLAATSSQPVTVSAQTGDDDRDDGRRPGRGQAGHGRRPDAAEQALPGLRRRPAHRPGQGRHGHRDRPQARQDPAATSGANPVDVNRRNFLKGTAAGAAGTALAGGVLIRRRARRRGGHQERQASRPRRPRTRSTARTSPAS